MRTELLDGELVCEPSPGLVHQQHVGAIFAALRSWAQTRSPMPSVLLGPLDIRFATGRILQPDVCAFLEPLAPGSATPITRVPELCVEIVSQRRTYDRVTKRLVYADAGVREMWTVLPEQGLVERWHGRGLSRREEVAGRLESALLPGFFVAVESLRG